MINIVDNKVNDSPINLINWRSNSPYSSSANNVWIRDNKLYDSEIESSGNQLHYPFIMVPGVIYYFETNVTIDLNFDTPENFYSETIVISDNVNISENTPFIITVTKLIFLTYQTSDSKFYFYVV